MINLLGKPYLCIRIIFTKNKFNSVGEWVQLTAGRGLQRFIFQILLYEKSKICKLSALLAEIHIN